MPLSPTSLAALGAATSDVAEILADGDLDAAVPGCPDWNLTQLGKHLGGIHQWAAHAITHGSPDGEATAAPGDRAGLVAWYRDSAAALIDVLRETPPDAPAWHFGPEPRTADFWLRRQVHETDLHLWDAHASQGSDLRLDPGRALDGIREVAGMFFPRQVRLGRIEPLEHAIVLEATNPGGPGWPAARRTPVVGRFVFSGDGLSGSPEPAATVSGAPDALLLLVWKRIGLDDVRVQVSGDHDAARTTLSQALTP